MCKGSQASCLSDFSVVKENLCFPAYSQLGPDTLTDVSKLLLMLFTLFVKCFLKYKVSFVMSGLRTKQMNGNMTGTVRICMEQ